MSFIWPVMLISLLSIPMLVGLYILLQRRRQRIAVNYGVFSGGQVARRQPGRLRHVPPALFLAGLGLLSLALARPQMTVNLPRVEGTVILVFDVSGSMAATDLQPDRMTAAKLAAQEFVQRQPPTVLVGVVAFSESGISVQAPSNDQEAVLASINRLQPQTGTSLGYGILTALETILTGNGEAALGGSEEEGTPAPTLSPAAPGSYENALIVLLSDGENTAPPDPFEAAYVAAQNGVRIYSIGVGSPQGATLDIGGYMVHTMLNETALEQIAGLTGGEYFNAASSEDFEHIYDQISPELVIKPEQMEVTSLLAGASIVVLLIGGLLMLFWFGRLP